MPTIRIRANELREQVIYQNPTFTPDEIGGDTEAFPDGDKVFAKIDSKMRTKVFEGGQIESVVTYTVTVREAPITDALKQRLKWVRTEKILEVQALERDDRDRAARLLCVEVPADN